MMHKAVQIYMDHICRLYPGHEDRRVLLSFLSACIRNPDEKLDWCIMLQGPPGCGKSAIMKPVLATLANDEHLAAGYGSGHMLLWANENIKLVTVEMGEIACCYDIKRELLCDRRMVHKRMKEPKIAQNKIKFVIYSNSHKGYRELVGDRRIKVLRAAQSHGAYLDNYGMDSAYFKELYGAMNRTGIHHINKYLMDWTEGCDA